MKLQVTGGAVVSLVGLVAVGATVIYARNSIVKYFTNDYWLPNAGKPQQPFVKDDASVGDSIKPLTNSYYTQPQSYGGGVTTQSLDSMRNLQVNGFSWAGIFGYAESPDKSSNYDVGIYDPNDPFAAPKPFDLDYNFGVIDSSAGWDE